MSTGARRGVRLTRRGRLVLVGSVALLGFLFAAAPGEAATPPDAAPVAVVGPDDTLWSIAAHYAPGQDPFSTIDEIRRLNGIQDYTVHPGQRLTLPRTR